jgi:hypothetical protein
MSFLGRVVIIYMALAAILLMSAVAAGLSFMGATSNIAGVSQAPSQTEIVSGEIVKDASDLSVQAASVRDEAGKFISRVRVA